MWEFFKPVRIGESIRVVMKVLEKKESKKGDRGLVTFEISVLNQRNEKVETGSLKLMMAKETYFES
jgi:acyl dehydratase